MAEGKTIFFSVMQSPVGPLLLAAGQDGLRHLQFHRGQLPRAAKGELWIESRERLEIYEQQVEAYFRGELREFTSQLDLQGTSFQKDCWQALLRIPYGETRTYAEIAREIGRPHAFRAVGQANHDNPIAIIVPCHRVLGADRTLTGYGGGLSTKEKLLRLEGAEFRLAQPAARAAKKCASNNGQQARFDM
jgi:methylated-DNA-[protein]-cysteine S-methyltransferase